MRKNKILKIIFPIIVLLIFALTAPAQKDEEIIILHTNDLHGSSLAQIATMVTEFRKEYPHLLLLDAGDLFSGTPLSAYFQGEVEEKAVLELSFDALALGNHDFDYGIERIKASQKAGVPWISANVFMEDGNTLVPPFIIKNVNATRILIVGLTTTSTPRMSFAENVAGLTFADPVSTLKKILQEQKNTYDLCIVLSHLGYGDDLLLAQKVPEITAIIGGHSHTVLTKPVRIKDTLITQTGSSGKYLGKLTIDLKADPIIQGDLLKVQENTEPYPKLAAIEKHYGTALKLKMAEIIGYTSRGYTKNAMGYLLNKALLEFSGADAALYNSGGVRAGLSSGYVTKDDIFNIEPFGNEAVVIALEGADFAKLLEITARRTSDFYTGPKLVDLSKNYTLVTSDFLANENSNYPMLAQSEVKPLSMAVRDILERYLITEILEQKKKAL